MPLHECPECGTEAVIEVVEYDYCDEETNFMVNDRVPMWCCPNCGWEDVPGYFGKARNATFTGESEGHE